MNARAEAELNRAIARQREWIAERGGNRAGYVLHYGSAADPDHYGAGGERIYEADRAVLADLEARLPRAAATR